MMELIGMWMAKIFLMALVATSVYFALTKKTQEAIYLVLLAIFYLMWFTIPYFI